MLANKRTVIIVFGLLALFAFTRLYNLLQLPLFTDEALYIRWLQKLVSSGQLWLPLTEDGQPPLFIWFASTFYLVFHDPLVSIRLLSVFFSLSSFGLLLLLVWRNTKKHASLIFAGLLYTFMPFLVWYDRLGMRESAMGLVSLVVFMGLCFHTQNPKGNGIYVALVGFIFGTLIKSTAWLLLPIILIPIVLTKKQLQPKKVLNSLIILCIPIGLLLSSAAGNQIIQKNSIFVLSSHNLGKNLWPNFIQAVHWLIQLTGIVFMLSLIATLISAWRRANSIMAVSLLFLLPLLIEIPIAQIFFPRYFLFVLPVLIVGVTTWWHECKNSSAKIAFFVAVILIGNLALVSTSYLIKPVSAAVPAIVSWQFISGWPSGYGIADAAAFVKQQAPAIILTESLDTTQTGLVYYQPSLKNKLHVFANDTLDADSLDLINQALNTNQKVMLVLNRLDTPPTNLEVTLLQEFTRPRQGKSVRVYEIRSLAHGN